MFPGDPTPGVVKVVRRVAVLGALVVVVGMLVTTTRSGLLLIRVTRANARRAPMIYE